jgi:citrate lyase subunit beta/citryl-CoA lyase
MSARRLPGPALLFCPADRPDRYEKALAVADVVVLDLEDAVAPANKLHARRALAEHPIDPARVVVRVNASGSHEHRADLDVLRNTAYGTVMLAKTESRAQVEALEGWGVVALCETPRGVLEAPLIAGATNAVALMWGAEDLVAALGGRSSRRSDRSFRDFALHARSAILIAAKAEGRQAIDAVFADFDDPEGLKLEAADGAQSGFDIKACIHPNQVGPVREAYRPGEADIERARKILEAARAGGVVSVDGQMVDGPLVRQAEQTVAWLER